MLESTKEFAALFIPDVLILYDICIKPFLYILGSNQIYSSSAALSSVEVGKENEEQGPRLEIA